AWLGSANYKGTQYGLPFMGECAALVYRTDVYEQKGVAVPDTLDDFMAAAQKLHDPGNNLYGAVLRGFKGPGQNMYVWPPIFRMFGGEWFDKDMNPTFNSKEGLTALEYYVKIMKDLSPSAAINWNWPEIGDAFAAGTIAQYMDGVAFAGMFGIPEKSKVVGKVGFHRMPKGPTGKRVSTIWTWSFPINAAVSEKRKKATWLWAQWMSSKEFQAQTSYEYKGSQGQRSADIIRQSIWKNDAYMKMLQFGKDFEQVTLDTLLNDLDPEWRPLVPQWPEIGNVLANTLQQAAAGQVQPKAGLDEAASLVTDIMKKK
ncbi:MAG: extracellular solute-binding protein, partial [Dehalococcoidales bacterium]|nr:extracellular solute-binding protein [Dehalococcoidales bacterium]